MFRQKYASVGAARVDTIDIDFRDFTREDAI